MRNYGWSFRVPYGSLILHRRIDYKKRERWVIQVSDTGPFEEEQLSRAEMLRLMTFPNHMGGMQIDKEELAMMMLEFKERPEATEGHFGVNGTFMFVK